VWPNNVTELSLIPLVTSTLDDSVVVVSWFMFAADEVVEAGAVDEVCAGSRRDSFGAEQRSEFEEDLKLLGDVSGRGGLIEGAEFCGLRLVSLRRGGIGELGITVPKSPHSDFGSDRAFRRNVRLFRRVGGTAGEKRGGDER